MPAEGIDLAQLVERLGKLGRADRQAVLGKLSATERRAVEEEEARQRADLSRTDRQFAGYSPWLARLVEQALAGEATPAALGETIRAAVAAAHRSTLETAAEGSIGERLLALLGLANAGNAAEAERC